MNVGWHVARLKNLGFSSLLAFAVKPTGWDDLPCRCQSELKRDTGTKPTATCPSIPTSFSAFITFRNKYGQTGVLDWKGDRAMYSGDLPIDQGADAFSKSLYVGKTCSDVTAVRGGPKDR